MLTLLVSISSAILLALFSYFVITPSVILSSIIFVVVMIAINFLMGRFFMKKLTAIFNSCEKDLKIGKTDIAIEKMKKGYIYSRWQFMVRDQIDSQIGMILYANKRFADAFPYLKNCMKKNYMAMSMLAAHYYRNKDYDKMEKTLDITTKTNPKDSFTQSLSAYLLVEIGKKDKAISILNKAVKKIPTDERIESNLEAVKNHKKIKMQNYGAYWMQLHLMKSPDGVQPYQTLIGRQKIKRR